MAIELGAIQRALEHVDRLELAAGPDQAALTGVVGILAADDVAAVCQPGDLVIVLDQPPPVGWPMDAFLRRCRDADARAVVLRRCPVDSGTRTLADRLTLPLLFCQQPWRVSLRVHDLLYAPVDARIGRLTTTLMAGLQDAGTDLASMLAAASRAAGTDFHLLDNRGRGLFAPVAWSDADQAVLELPIPKTTGSFDIVLPSGTRLIARRVELTGRDVWLGVTVPGGDLVGAEVLIHGLAIVQTAVAQRLAALQLVHERDSRTRATLLSEVMEAGPEPSEDLLRRCLAADWDIRAWHVGIRIVALGEGATISLRDDLLAAFTACDLRLRAVEQTDGWTAWLSFVVEPSGPIGKLSAAIRRAQLTLQPTLPTAVGVGSLLPGAAGLVKTLGQASDAARIAVNRPSSGHFVHIDRLGLPQLLLALAHTDVFTPAAKSLLDPLGPPGGILVTTLATWLDSGGSQAETAAVLGIHRNTVAQRLAHISEALAINLSDPESRLALHLACRAVRTTT